MPHGFGGPDGLRIGSPVLAWFRDGLSGYGPEDFPGCESFHLPEGALESYDGRQDGD